jgi:hypothetical protein
MVSECSDSDGTSEWTGPEASVATVVESVGLGPMANRTDLDAMCSCEMLSAGCS